MDLPQILLLTAIFVISIILTIIGVQIIFLLRDARETLKKADNLLSDIGYLSNNLLRTSSGLSHLASGLQSGMQVVELVSKLLSSKKK
ncbi:MAG: hypothetical protein UY18_C0001G0009 [Microgenomates group bacterium GW2011_GWF2_47_9]|nr:MAG: hypothetical protein UY18_C0001G0009 [Microgenomates group bacterium GW2011_GWF2_47_9]